MLLPDPGPFGGSSSAAVTFFLGLPRRRTVQPRILSTGFQALTWPREQKCLSSVSGLDFCTSKALLLPPRPHGSTESRLTAVAGRGRWEGMPMCAQVTIFLELESETCCTSANATRLEEHCLSPQINYLGVELELNAPTSSWRHTWLQATSFSQWLLVRTLLLRMPRQTALSLFNSSASYLHPVATAELCNYEHWREGVFIKATCFTNTASDEAHRERLICVIRGITILLLGALLFFQRGKWRYIFCSTKSC